MDPAPRRLLDMKTYGQYCPIAQASEVLAERWTPIILRNLLLGSTAFSEIAAGAPGLSRTCSPPGSATCSGSASSRPPQPQRTRLPLPPHRRRRGPGPGHEGPGDLGRALWIIFDGERSEVCRKHPGFEVDLFVQAEPAALAEWHLGRIEWADALGAERIRVLGPAALARALPTWNRRSPAAQANRMPEHGQAAGTSGVSGTTGSMSR
jgi:hypothetical protein